MVYGATVTMAARDAGGKSLGERLYHPDRTSKILAEERFDGLIASAPENVTYFTGLSVPSPYLRREVHVFAVLAANVQEDPVLVMPASFLAFLADEPGNASMVRVYGDPHVVFPPPDVALDQRELHVVQLFKWTPRFRSALEALLAVLSEKHIMGGRLGMDETGISPVVWAELLERLSETRVEPGAGILRRIRAVKTPPEIALLRRSAEITEAAQADLFSAVRAGVTEKELTDVLERRILAEGGRPAFSYLGLGPRGGTLRPPLAVRARLGDLIRTEMGCTYRHYWSDTGRTGVLGAPSNKQRGYFEALAAGHQIARETLRAGVRAGVVCDAVVRTVRKAGIPEYQRTHCGHGIGLQLYDLPLLAPADQTVLEAGMVVNVEVPYYEIGFGGMQIEDTLLVTSADPTVLGRTPQELRSL